MSSLGERHIIASHSKEELGEIARHAHKALGRLLPGLTSYASSALGKSIRVSSGPRTETSPTQIFIRPPLALGIRQARQHVSRECGNRDENGLLTCPACLSVEHVLVGLRHEISHHLFETFEPIPYAEFGYGSLLSLDVDPVTKSLALILEDMRIDRLAVDTVPAGAGAQLAITAELARESLEKIKNEPTPDDPQEADEKIKNDLLSEVSTGLLSVYIGADVIDLFSDEARRVLDDEVVLDLVGDDFEKVEIPALAVALRKRLAALGVLPPEPENEQGDGDESGDEGESGSGGQGDETSEDHHDDSSDYPDDSGSGAGGDPGEESDLSNGAGSAGDSDGGGTGDDRTEGEPGEGDDSEQPGGGEAGEGGESSGVDDGSEAGENSGDGAGEEGAGAGEEGAGEEGSDSEDSDAGVGDGSEGASGSSDGAGDDPDDDADPVDGDGGDDGGSDAGGDSPAAQPDSAGSDSEAPLGDGGESDSWSGAGVAELAKALEAGNHHAEIHSHEGNFDPDNTPGRGATGARVEVSDVDDDELSDEDLEAIFDQIDHQIEALGEVSETFDRVNIYRVQRGEMGPLLGPVPGRETDFSDDRDIGGLIGRARRVFSDNQAAKRTRGQRRGRVDTGLLGKRAWNPEDGRVFGSRVLPNAPDYSVLIGLDNSASTTTNHRWLRLRKCGDALAQVCHRTGVEFGVYAHTEDVDYRSRSYDMSLEIYQLKGFDEAWTPQVRGRLSHLDVGDSNIDGSTLRLYRRELEARRTERKILLFFTDGMIPGVGGEVEAEVMRAEVDACRRAGITLLGVGVDTRSPESFGIPTVSFNRVSQMNDVLDFLAKEFGV